MKEMDKKDDAKRPHRALVLQGGGALGAYEAGVFKRLAQTLREEDKRNGQTGRPLFDIVAGTSIGAVNASIIVNYVLKNKTWENVENELSEFWDYVSDPLWWFGNKKVYESAVENNRPYFNMLKTNESYFDHLWDILRTNRNSLVDFSKLMIDNLGSKNGIYFPVLYFREKYPFFEWTAITNIDKWREERPWIYAYFLWPDNLSSISTLEGVRKYYSYVFSVLFGVPNVLSAQILQPDSKFFDFMRGFSRFDNKPLENSMENFWDFKNEPIKTMFEENEPRLLLVAVDPLNSNQAVTFDSYLKSEGKCKTTYDIKNKKYSISYDGISIEHVSSSMATHLRYKYPKFQAMVSEPEGKDMHYEERYFWDGAYISNTPVRELIQAHRDFWHKEKGAEVPDLEIYVVNLYPNIENSQSKSLGDLDLIQDREIDIKFSDKTRGDLQMASTITDYVDLANNLIELGLKYTKNDSEFNKAKEDLLNKHGYSKGRNNQRRKLRELLEGRFRITKIGYVERTDDENTIFGKAFEFSRKTIDELRNRGYEDAKNIEYVN